MFVYILLGMELFAVRQGTEAEYQAIINSTTNRSNFNSFLSSFIVIFTILTGENWDDTMFLFTR